MVRLTPDLYASPLRVEGGQARLGLRKKMKKTMRREPLQLVFWTRRELHLMQPGRQAAADKQHLRSLQKRTEWKPKKEAHWVAGAYEDFWDGKQWG